MYVHRCDANPDEPSDNLKTASVLWREQEQASLQQSLHSLQIQFAGERAQREEVEREAELLARENAALEQKLAGLDGCRVCQKVSLSCVCAC